LKIGITGQNGFVGWHLSKTIKYFHPNDFQLIPFERIFFSNPNSLDNFASKCDCIVHLAGLNRAKDERQISKVNIALTKQLTESFKRINYKGKLIFSSSAHEKNDSSYGASKKEARQVFINASEKIGFEFSGLIIPNIFGPFCKPNYNSFIATFCEKIINKIEPVITVDNEIELLYVGILVEEIIKNINKPSNSNLIIAPQKNIKVSHILKKLNTFNNQYIVKGEIPQLDSMFDLHLFNTFKSYLNFEEKYPIKHKENIDDRGSFSEIVRSKASGQVSYSVTNPNSIRGNHFHTRKIERFSVIQGKALIQLRKIGSNTIHNFRLNGNIPSFVDMPIWYTHNITNIGEGPLITLFWINEPYYEKDSDTYFEIV
jgi:UDP-2-acetamido-2,6-beta-L-arabino-hexul-4-ose reductase